MKIGLIGATGLVGRQVLVQLLDDPACESLRVWARRDNDTTADKLDWQVVDFAHLDEALDCQGLDAVLCCLGTTTAVAGREGLERVDLNYVLGCAQAARAAEVPYFSVISAVGANCASPVHYSRTKGRMESALVTLSFDSLDILRPSLLLGQREEHRPGEALGQRLAPLLNAFLIGPLRRYRAVEAADVAAAMITLAKRSAPGTHIHYLPLSS